MEVVDAGTTGRFWGKLSRDQERWHPLIDHCAEVVACCAALLRTAQLRRRLARNWGERGSEFGAVR
ncbi:MAG: hypothetical protein IVW54_20540 [Candidatus Binataceae bacterium]|nr:hypothetical protein [Candidatus Binataceae bacterium]